MRKQLVALTLSAAMAAGMLSGCGGYGSGSGGQKDAAEAAGTAAALAVRDQVTPAEISVKELQNILKQQNRLLPV